MTLSHFFQSNVENLGPFMQNKPVLMVHYIRMWVVFAFFCLLATVAGLCALVDVAISGAGMGFMIFVAALSCALSLYCLICANSLHVKMTQDLQAHAVGLASVKRYGATEEDPLNGAERLDEFSFE
ncbi:hypothetical protein FOCC_FOCC012282 [Frankliniella occidentalis]|nr:hypothetical protein FOCC_FOCC012282 [Frankliniella occidentalis]